MARVIDRAFGQTGVVEPGAARKVRRIPLTLAAFILICFFLPWVQFNCGGVQHSSTGFDLARGGDWLLWFIPASMALVIVMLAVARRLWESLPSLVALTTTVAGGISVYLMYGERSSTKPSSGIVLAEWTVAFWCGLLASVALTFSGVWIYWKRVAPP